MAVVSQAITPEFLTTRRPTGALLRSALGLRRTQIGVGLLLLILAVVLLGPRVAPHDPNAFVGIPSSLGVPGRSSGRIISARMYGAVSSAADSRSFRWRQSRPRWV